MTWTTPKPDFSKPLLPAVCGWRAWKRDPRRRGCQPLPELITTWLRESPHPMRLRVLYDLGGTEEVSVRLGLSTSGVSQADALRRHSEMVSELDEMLQLFGCDPKPLEHAPELGALTALRARRLPEVWFAGSVGERPAMRAPLRLMQRRGRPLALLVDVAVGGLSPEILEAWQDVEDGIRHHPSRFDESDFIFSGARRPLADIAHRLWGLRSSIARCELRLSLLGDVPGRGLLTPLLDALGADVGARLEFGTEQSEPMVRTTDEARRLLWLMAHAGALPEDGDDADVAEEDQDSSAEIPF